MKERSNILRSENGGEYDSLLTNKVIQINELLVILLFHKLLN